MMIFQNDETLKKIKMCYLDSHLLSVLADSSAFLVAHTHVKLGFAVTLLSCSQKTGKCFLIVLTLGTFYTCHKQRGENISYFILDI